MSDPFPVMEHMTVKTVREYLGRRQSLIIPLGVMGYPERASRETGEQIGKRVVEDGAARILDLESRSDGVYKEVPFTPPPLIFDL